MKRWKAGSISLALMGAALFGTAPVSAGSGFAKVAGRTAPGLSDVLTRLHTGAAPESVVDALLGLELDRAALDPRSVGAEHLARAVGGDDQSSDGSLTGVFAAPVLDLDGDGRRDFLKIKYLLYRGDVLYNGKVFYETYRGTDGRSLWKAELDVEEAFPLTYSIPLGKRHGNGLLIEELGIVRSGGSFATRLELTAFAGDGRRAWERRFDPGTSVPGARSEGLPLMSGLADLAPGRAADVLVGVTTLTGPTVGLVHVMSAETRAVVVDGESGEIFEDPAPETNWSTSPRPGAGDYQGDWIPMPLPAADASGDGVDDYFYAMARPRHSGRLSMRSSVDGDELWAVENVPVGVFTAANPGGDFDDDGTNDLLLTTMLSPPLSDQSLPYGDLLRAVSGADGETLWGGTGRYASIPGDVDGDRLDDVVTVSSFYAPKQEVVGMEYAGFSGPDGKPLYTTRHTMPYVVGKNALLFSVFGGAGDLEADDAEDFYFHQSLVQPEEERRTSTKMVSGRTGRKVFDGLPWVPLDVSVDGAGDDVLRIDARDKDVVFTVADVRGGDTIWKARYRTAAGYAGTEAFGGFAPMWSSGGLYSADSCPDVATVMSGESGVFLVVLDGRDGSLEWSRRLLGKGEDAFASAVVVRDRARC